jgi:hypothetical protein
MPVSAEVSYARLLRPFPARRLRDVLWQVQANAAAVSTHVERLMIEPPASAEDCRFELDHLRGLLFTLAAACGEADPALGGLGCDADRAYRVAEDAVRVILEGLRGSDTEAPVAPVEPVQVPEDPERVARLRTAA